MSTTHKIPLPSGKIFEVWTSPSDDKQALIQEL